MKPTTSEAIREAFIEYFTSCDKPHEAVASSQLVPANDPSLLFTNAGMVQFKEVFLGGDKRDYTRAVTAQKCLRVGGKHNDLDQVGFTKRHHTFFEMLGNFSFGDYFKEEAIAYAWTFLTEKLGLPKEKLWITVYQDDQESADIWMQTMGIPQDRIIYCGDADNFWSMGDTGPCGPCTEIFYDHGPSVAGGPPGSADADGDRYVEIWNVVFMQYDRQADGQLIPLPKPSVDTGMGLERISAVMQGVSDNFDIDLFKQLIAAIEQINPQLTLDEKAKRVMADHIRSAAFLIADGIYPSNEGRGYVLRRIIRRAVRFGYQSGLPIPFFHRLVGTVVSLMGDAYPQLVEKQLIIQESIEREETQFALTIKQGMRVLEKELAAVKGGVLSGEIAFTLYDTYGFPLDLTEDVAAEHGAQVDQAVYEKAMEKQRAQSKQNQGFSDMGLGKLPVTGVTEFLGYEGLVADATIQQIYHGAEAVNEVDGQASGVTIIVDKTTCYAESGGQVGDRGLITSANGVFTINDTQKQGKVILHQGSITQGKLRVGDAVEIQVDASRQAIKLNHSATHLLHAALRHVLGEHVIQKGSLVDKDRLRFDFAHYSPVTPEQLVQVESIVNQQIMRAIHAEVVVTDQATAKAAGAMALFGEKYEDRVRVIKFGDFSVELCGGTHVSNTAEIGACKITGETGIASGVRRIEAVTGVGVLTLLEEREALLSRIARLVKGDIGNVENRVSTLLAKHQTLLESTHSNKQSSLAETVQQIWEAASSQGDYRLLRHTFDGLSVKELRLALDQLKAKAGHEPTVAILGSVMSADKVLVLVYVSETLTTLSAVDILHDMRKVTGGSGGGKSRLAQGVSASPEGFSEWIQGVKGFLL